MKTVEMLREDQDKLFKLLVKGNTYEEIGSILNLSTLQVSERIKRYFPYLRDIKFYKENKEDIFSGVQQMAMSEIAGKLSYSSLKDLTTLIGVLDDKIFRLQNPDKANGTSISINIENLVNKKEQLTQGLKEKGVSLHDLEYKLAEAICIDNTTMPVKQIERTLAPVENTDTQEYQFSLF